MGRLVELVPWVFVALAAWYCAQVLVLALRASADGPQRPPGDRTGAAAAVVAALTTVLAARALGPWDALTWPLWGLLVAVLAWAVVLLATAWRRLPWRAEGSRGRRSAAVGLALEVGLLAVVVVFLSP